MGLRGDMVQGIWTTSLRGEGLHLVGLTEIDRKDFASFGFYSDKAMRQRPSWLAWLPGGKKLSFRLDNAIWTVPVD